MKQESRIEKWLWMQDSERRADDCGRVKLLLNHGNVPEVRPHCGIDDRIGEFAMNSLVESELYELHEEVYSALHANNRRLATMGARALLDMAMTDKVKDVGQFNQKLDALEKEASISKKQREFLEAALDAGNAASHRGHCPTAKQLDQVMDIVENVIQQIYVLPNAAAELKKSTPPRKKSAK
jgi:hypothetical protein